MQIPGLVFESESEIGLGLRLEEFETRNESESKMHIDKTRFFRENLIQFLSKKRKNSILNREAISKYYYAVCSG